ncbi:MAG: DUF6878 family protein [Pseudomonadota bacterium]
MTDHDAAYDALLEEMRVKREDALRVTRAALLPQLRALGITMIRASYDGEGDEGNVEGVDTVPHGIDLPVDLDQRFRSFAWDVAYTQHPGFENNEGGRGVMTWDLTADSISLEHAFRYVDYTLSTHEDL